MADVIAQRSETGDETGLLRISTGEDGRLYLEIDDCGPSPARIALDLNGAKHLRAVVVTHCGNAEFAASGEDATRGGYRHLREEVRDARRLRAAMNAVYGDHCISPIRRSADDDRLIGRVR